MPCASADSASSPLTAARQHAGRPGAAGQLGRPTAWLFGNEAWGLPADMLALADEAVAVPIYGQAESLNLAAAAAVCLYASARAQVPPGTSRCPCGKPDGAVTSPRRRARGTAVCRAVSARV